LTRGCRGTDSRTTVSEQGGIVSTIEQSIEVDVPIETVYNQWTQFEEFPQFMEGVESVQQTDDTHLRWVTKIGGHQEEWSAEITEQSPEERVAWKATEGKQNAGVVTFHRLADTKTKIMVQMDWQPEGVVEKVGDLVGADERRVQGDLKRFKAMIESRGTETGAWRGDVPRVDER